MTVLAMESQLYLRKARDTIHTCQDCLPISHRYRLLDMRYTMNPVIPTRMGKHEDSNIDNTQLTVLPADIVTILPFWAILLARTDVVPSVHPLRAPRESVRISCPSS